MYARVATYEGGDMERLAQMAEERRAAGEGMPESVRRMMVLHDEGSRRQLFVTFFDSREAVEAAQPQFEAMGEEVPEDVGGRGTSVHVYEVVMDEEQ